MTSRNEQPGHPSPSTPVDELKPWSWVSIPDDLGVLNVGGRIGASRGPEAVSRIFDRIGGWDDVRSSLVSKMTVTDIGSDIEANLAAAANAVAQAHQSAGTSVVIGGGHDHGYSQLLGVRRTLPKDARLGCIYLDAHLDVRPPVPVVSSGSPFHLALEEGLIEPNCLVPFGIQPQSNTRALLSYVQKKGVSLVTYAEVRSHKRAMKRFLSELERLEEDCDAIVLSVDLDCMAQAAAPGVSAPQAEGFDARDVLAMVEAAARSPKVKSLGIFELNPIFDRDDATARIAATAIWRFVANR